MKTPIIHHKVFGIGLNKTGTTTLGQCGEILGFRSTSCDRDLLEDFVVRKDLSGIRRKAEQYDFFEDWPWPLLYKELDLMFPGSKFILTVRKSEEDWFESLKKHALRTHPTKHCRKLAYGHHFPHHKKAEFIDIYRNHNACVRDYFKDRRDDFLELCWETGDGFERLCDFLDLKVPDKTLPHANRAIDQDAITKKGRLLTNRFLSLLNY